MTDKIEVPMELLEELRDCAELCADYVRAHDLGEDSAETHFRQVGRACDALLREAPQPAEQQPAPDVPEGWALVPVEPTEEMLAATSWPNCAGTDYRHMLEAAPKFGEEE